MMAKIEFWITIDNIQKEAYIIKRSDRAGWIAAFPDEQSARDYLEFLSAKFKEDAYNEIS